MYTKAFVVAVAAVAVSVGAGAARADTMHPVLGARLSGMGEHGVVNFQSMAAKGRLCWTFSLQTKGITGASIRDSAGMVVAKLGSGYTPKGCSAVTAKALTTIDAKPARYIVWVDTKGHPGDLRGKLFAGMAHM
jgi:hypothetical protein